MFAAASAFFSRSAISQSYSFSSGSTPSSLNGSRSSTPTPGAVPTPAVRVGPWRVQAATHKVTNKRVSVWSFNKSTELDGVAGPARDKVIEVLKLESSALSKFRHPCILEMVEPLEDTRTELIFATEPILAPLELAITSSSSQRSRSNYSASSLDLDEIEIQKGILQLCKGLSFLHTSARLIHSNIRPDTVIINDAGDWKISGLGLTIPLTSPEGKPTRWEFPTFDGRMPVYVQRSFDYMAPEYALDEQHNVLSDMYSLGCLIYAVHARGSPPLKTHGSLGALRDNSNDSRLVADVDRFDPDLQSLLRVLLTRQPTSRPSPADLPSYGFFSSLPISTLSFLDRSTFATKTREEKITFMRGLTSVLERFSEGLRVRKVLPSLLEEMKDTQLLPYILPNVFAIANVISANQFASLVLPKLKPLFALKDPPQCTLTLLDNLTMLQEKTEKKIFQSEVLPLVYHALESEHSIVQERALKTVPDLCETIDYAEVSSVLFPRVALVFTRTKILSVKVATLITFHSMVKTLDQTNLTQKLVPLLSKIRTKEPAVTMATLEVQEAMGFKVDREAVATLVLPQLWAMSMGPLLTLEQFSRFMEVIKKLGDRVEREHSQFLRDAHRVDSSSAPSIAVNGSAATGGAVDFESLVGRANGTVKQDSAIESKGWDDDDMWGSILSAPAPSADTARSSSPVVSPSQPMQLQPSIQSSFHSSSSSQSLPASPRMSINTAPARPSKLGAKPIPSSSFNSAFNSSLQSNSNTLPPPLSPPSSSGFGLSSPPSTSAQKPQQPQRPNYNISLSTSPIVATPQTQQQQQPSKPNYNLSLSPMGLSSPSPPPLPSMAGPPLSFSLPPLQPSAPSIPAGGTGGMGLMGSMMTPMQPSRLSTPSKPPTSNDWGDFDPLK